MVKLVDWKLKGVRGQASVEYLAVSVGVLIAIGVFWFGYDVYCTSNAENECRDLWDELTRVFQKEIYQITTLLNLP